MRSVFVRCFILLAALGFGARARAAERVFEFESWRVGIDSSNGNITIVYGADTLLLGSNAVWGADNHRRAMRQASAYRAAMSDNSDIYGSGKLIRLRATYATQHVEQRIYLYSGKPYLHTELEVEATDGVWLCDVGIGEVCQREPIAMVEGLDPPS